MSLLPIRLSLLLMHVVSTFSPAFARTLAIKQYDRHVHTYYRAKERNATLLLGIEDSIQRNEQVGRQMQISARVASIQTDETPSVDLTEVDLQHGRLLAMKREAEQSRNRIAALHDRYVNAVADMLMI